MILKKKGFFYKIFKIFKHKSKNKLNLRTLQCNLNFKTKFKIIHLCFYIVETIQNLNR